MTPADLTATLSATHEVDGKEELVFQKVRPDELGLKRSDLKFKSVICSQKTGNPFAIAELENGKFAAVWPAHAFVADTLDDLQPQLNQRERVVLELRAHAA